MPRMVYIQADAGGQPYSANGASAARGFAFLGYEVRFFLPEELPDLPLTPETVVVGGMGTVQAALSRIVTHLPSQTTVPTVLYPYLGRGCWRTTPQEVRQRQHFPVFLKPYENAKVFTGQVVKNMDALNTLLKPRPDFPVIAADFPLLAQEPVNFLSEWRAFVLRGSILGISHYAGDALVFPSAGAIRITLGGFQGAPAGYSADFGVTDDGLTLLVEINDGYSLGNGGLVADLYAELLQARWEEMTGVAF
jgi:hypothetical protein